MRVWRVHRYGAPSEALELDDVADPVPGPGALAVRVHAAALNLNDTDMCRGRYPTINPPLPFPLGMEVVGVVDAAGPGLEKWVGRRVVAVPQGGHGGYADRALVPVDMSFDAPASLADEQAAAFLIPFHTAHLALHRRGRLQAGETLVVHSGAGGVGSAAVQLGVAAGARVIATAGGPEKIAFCKELGAEIVVDYGVESFVDVVLDATGGRGADLICDLVGGDVATRSFACTAREGRYLIAGFSGGSELGETGIAPRPIAWGNFDVIGVMMSWRTEDASPPMRRAGFNSFPRSVGEEIHEDLLALLDAGRIRPIVGRVVEFEGIPAALEDLESRRTLGKTVARVAVSS